MSTATVLTPGRNRQTRKLLRFWARLAFFGLLPVLLTGCITPPFGIGQPAESPKPVDSMVIGAGLPPGQEAGPDAKIYAEFAQAKEMFNVQDWAAEKLFHNLAKNKKSPTVIQEESRFLEAECQVKQNQLTKAARFYLARYGTPQPPARFDVVAIVWPTGREPQIRHTPDAFQATF